jgi:hypothetical protein
VVRLSATFPYVSPICRPEEPWGPDESLDYHFADGGYVDNEGMVTVIDWLRRLFAPGALAPAERARLFDQILLVRINPFPVQAAVPRAEVDQGWIYSTLGPINALQRVRVASQSERNNIAVQMFTEVMRAHEVPVHEAKFTFHADQHADAVPLSWTLTRRQKQHIDDAWSYLLADRGNPDGPLSVTARCFG